MTLWGFILPLIISVIVAVVAHARVSNYWSACVRSGIVIAAFMMFWLIALKVFFWNTTEFSALQLGWYALLAAGAGVIAIGVACLVGIPFVMDRQIQSREHDRCDGDSD